LDLPSERVLFRNGDGLLDSDEMEGLVDWLLSTFRPGGRPFTRDELHVQSSKLIEHLDKDGDGLITFDEFGLYFEELRTAEVAHLHNSHATDIDASTGGEF
jgi:Ca2+-binding EF-hand superfamily protein